MFLSAPASAGRKYEKEQGADGGGPKRRFPALRMHMEKKYRLLIINPGSTSTKIGVFSDETLLFDETLRHSTEEIAQYGSIYEQKDFRKEVILNILKEKEFDFFDKED